MKYVNNNDIVVVNGTPNDIPFCRGIITTDFQPPLSHIVVLSHNRKTPIMALKDAWSLEEIRNLNGKLVKFSLNTNDYSLTEATVKQATKYWNKDGFKKIKKLKMSLKKLEKKGWKL